MVGVEPTRQSPVLKHFECSLLRPLEYICIFNFVAGNFPRGAISSQSRYDRFDTPAYIFWHRLAQRLEKCEISMQDNDERLGTRHPIKPAVMGFPADKVTCRMQTFECSLLRVLAYICLFSSLLYKANRVYSIIPAAAGVVNSSGAGSWKIWRALCGWRCF